ncbi:MAG: 4-hydroxy-tetrahydrodipicolinate reductase [Alphaproteobacteria bacterium]|nr:4-hydroxy-tetrahydrodipicolinate reductase [Alphaproteobacteria bacterium]
MSLKVGVTGYKGRMGQLLVREIEAAADLEFAGGIDMGDDAEALFNAADVVIDFSVPDATITHARLAANCQTALVIGTTGLSEKQEMQIADSATKTAIIYAANMSVGVNILMALVEQAAARLGTDWDIEVFETHHNQKIDSPSGTALALGKAARKGRGGGDFVTDRTGKRNAGDIGYAVQRGGDVVGEHDVTFFSQGERIILGHKATDRRLFAQGALRAARWTKGKSAGLYSMKDVLDL